MELLQGQAGQKGYKGDTGLPGFDGIPGTKVFVTYFSLYELCFGTGTRVSILQRILHGVSEKCHRFGLLYNFDIDRWYF